MPDERGVSSERRDGPPILEARGIVKRFGHVEALRGVDFAARH